MISLRSVAALLGGALIVFAGEARGAEAADAAPANEAAVIVVKAAPRGETVWTYPGNATVIGADDLQSRQFTTLATLSQLQPEGAQAESGPE